MQDLSIYNTAYFERDIAENWFKDLGLLRPDQLAAICYAYGLPFNGKEEDSKRDPGHVVSIGCGTGELEQWFERRGHTVTGVDPTEGAKLLYKGKTLIPEYEGAGDTIIFCESLEHIPLEQIKHILALVPHGSRIIVTNWLDYWPLDANPPDHITPLNSNLYDYLSNKWNVIVRNKSHLVMEKP